MAKLAEQQVSRTSADPIDANPVQLQYLIALIAGWLATLSPLAAC